MTEPIKTTDNEKAPPTPEVLEKPVRRTFSMVEKTRILEEADDCTVPGQLDELLRREGIYSSYLNTWRKQREQGTLAGLTPKRDGWVSWGFKPIMFPFLGSSALNRLWRTINLEK